MCNNTYYFFPRLFVTADSNSINRMLSNSNQPGTGKNRYLLNIYYCYTIHSRRATPYHIVCGCSDCSATHGKSLFLLYVIIIIIIIHNIHRYRSNNNNTSSGKGQYHQNHRGTWPKRRYALLVPAQQLVSGFGHSSNGNESKAFVTFGRPAHIVYTLSS